MITTSNPSQIDPRGPRFGAGITSGVLIVALFLGLLDAPSTTLGPAWWLMVIISLLFAWGTLAGPTRHPYGVLFRRWVQPRLSPPASREAPAPVRFAQLVGLIVSLVGVIAHLAGLPYALITATAVAFVAAFLNAAFGLCLGCELYSVLLRLRRTR